VGGGEERERVGGGGGVGGGGMRGRVWCGKGREGSRVRVRGGVWKNKG